MTRHGGDPVGTGARLSITTPIGRLVIEGDDVAITRIHLPDGTASDGTAPGGAGGATPPLHRAVEQLEEYFAGERTTFSLPLAPHGTGFQLAVWRALADIPYGETVTYGELAARVGRPAAFRAVGQANGANPIPIVYPCHRVVAAGSRLGGYAGGLDVKRRLLALEGSVAAAW